MNKRKISIHSVILMYMSLVGILSIISLGIVWFFSELAKFDEDVEHLRTTYVEGQKTVIKREVNRALNFVTFMQSKTEIRLQDSVRNRVYEAYSIVESLYNTQRGQKNLDEIKATIKRTLRPIRFNKGRGYYFIFTLDGIETLFPVSPELEGTSMLGVRGGKGEQVVPEMIALVKQNGEGFYRYTWPKPDHDGYFPKIAFVKLFEPLGWVIGTGEYLDDVKKDIQAESLAWISNIRFGDDGYVFAGRWDGMSLSGPATGRNMYPVEDANGVKIVQELIRVAKAGGGFVSYVLPKFEGKKQAPKISYAVGVPEWQWYIGSGVYIDEIDAEIARRKSELNQRIRTNIRNAVIVLMSLLLLTAALVKFLSNQIGNNLKLFGSFFKRASTDAIEIDPEGLHFSEFAQLAESANEMTDKRKQAESALRENEERLKAIIENLPDAFFVHDMQGRLLQVNQAACTKLGYPREELIGMIVTDIEQSVSNEAASELWQTVATGTSATVEGLHRRKDGSSFPTEITIASTHINEETLIFGYARDITERKQIEAERQDYQVKLIQAQKMEAIGTLAGGIAHDFNNLLMTIQGRASLMSYDLEASHPCRGHVNAIIESSRSATDLTKQLLGIAQGGKYEVRPIDINQVVQASAEMFGRTKKEVRIHTQLHDPPPVALADGGQIEQVLLNLFINAWQAMPGGGDLFLETEIVDLDDDFCEPHSVPAGTFVKISVMDTGMGMDRNTQQRIFDPFFTTKEKLRGTGLGLASAYGIVKNHAGIITVSSDVGQGTTFEIYLPASETKPPSEVNAQMGIIRGSGTVLLVDDEAMILDVGKAMLERLGYRVLIAENGEQALDVVAHQSAHVDLVVLDMVMPGMGGSETFDRLRKLRPSIPVILSSGYSIDGQASGIMAKGCDGFIQKPFSLPELSQKIRKILDNRNK